MKNSPKQNVLWPDESSSLTESTTKLESSIVKVGTRKYFTFGVVLVLLVVAGLTFHFYSEPTNKGERMTELQACQKKCAPRFGEIKGERRIPNASQYERRNYEINAKCVCS